MRKRGIRGHPMISYRFKSLLFSAAAFVFLFAVPFRVFAVTDDAADEAAGVSGLSEQSELPDETPQEPGDDVSFMAEEELPAEDTPEAEIDFLNERFTGLSQGEYSVTANGVVYAVFADVSGETGIDQNWFAKTVFIVKNGDGAVTSDSAAQSLAVPARPAAVYVTGSDIAPGTPQSGSLFGVTAAMEYRPERGSVWFDGPVSGSSVSGLVSGVYLVRVKATESSFAGFTGEAVIATGPAAFLSGKTVRFTGSNPVSWEIDMPYIDFWRLMSGGLPLVEGRDYSAAAGSTVIALSGGYLSGLQNGTYTLRAEWQDGSGAVIYCEPVLVIARSGSSSGAAQTDSVVDSSDAPYTGDDSDILFWLPVLFVCAAAVIFFPSYAARLARRGGN